MEDQQVEIMLLPAPDEKTESPDYQRDLRYFVTAVRANGLKPSVGIGTMDAAAGVSSALYNGGIRIAIAALGPVAIVQVRKLIEAFLRMRAGRKLKLKFGDVTVEGHPDDVAKLVTEAQIAKMLKAPKKSARKKQLRG